MDIAVFQQKPGALSGGGVLLLQFTVACDDRDGRARISFVINKDVLQSAGFRIHFVRINDQVKKAFRKDAFFDRSAHLLPAQVVDKNFELPVSPRSQIKRRFRRENASDNRQNDGGNRQLAHAEPDRLKRDDLGILTESRVGQKHAEEQTHRQDDRQKTDAQIHHDPKHRIHLHAVNKNKLRQPESLEKEQNKNEDENSHKKPWEHFEEDISKSRPCSI